MLLLIIEYIFLSDFSFLHRKKALSQKQFLFFIFYKKNRTAKLKNEPFEMNIISSCLDNITHFNK